MMFVLLSAGFSESQSELTLLEVALRLFWRLRLDVLNDVTTYPTEKLK
jgi:hypothetical protein